MFVVDEEAVLDDQLLMGRVRKGSQSDSDYRDGGEHAEDELRPTVCVAHVDGVDQYPGHGGDQACNTGGGHSGFLRLDPRCHTDGVFVQCEQVLTIGTRGGGSNCCLFTSVRAMHK